MEQSSPVHDISPIQEYREQLAAIFRWTARIGMHEGVANHYSFAVDANATQFLINPNGRHFSNVCASDLLLLDTDDSQTMQRNDAPDPTAWAIHAGIHMKHAHARCVLHVHSQYATALASLADSSLPPIDQNAMRFYNRIVIDNGFDGMGLDEEAERLSRGLGEHGILLLANHGVIAVGESVAVAFSHLYYFERACRNYFTALSSGLPLRIASHDVAEKTARQWQDFIVPLAKCHLKEIREVLDREDPSYKT